MRVYTKGIKDCLKKGCRLCPLTKVRTASTNRVIEKKKIVRLCKSFASARTYLLGPSNETRSAKDEYE